MVSFSTAPSAARRFLDSEQRNLFSEDSEDEHDNPPSRDNSTTTDVAASTTTSNDSDLAAAYSNVKSASRTNKRTIEKLTADKLTGPHGLDRIRAWPRRRLASSSIPHTARYTSDLLQAYADWCQGLLSSQHYQDVLASVHTTWGSKPSVQAYLKDARAAARDAAVARVLGHKAAEQLLAQVEDRQRQQQSQHDDNDYNDNAAAADNSGNMGNNLSSIVVQESPLTATVGAMSATTAAFPPVVATEPPTAIQTPTAENPETTAAAAGLLANPVTVSKRPFQNDNDDDSEEEAQFDDVKELTIPGSAKDLRHSDSDKDDDEDNDSVEAQAKSIVPVVPSDTVNTTPIIDQTEAEQNESIPESSPPVPTDTDAISKQPSEDDSVPSPSLPDSKDVDSDTASDTNDTAMFTVPPSATPLPVQQTLPTPDDADDNVVATLTSTQDTRPDESAINSANTSALAASPSSSIQDAGTGTPTTTNDDDDDDDEVATVRASMTLTAGSELSD